MPIKRRQFLLQSSKAAMALAITANGWNNTVFANHTTAVSAFGYQQKPLPYAYNALEKAIDALTMEIHYTKHAAGYAKNLADAIVTEKVNTNTVSIEQLLTSISKYSTKMRNNAGGHYNHEHFWESLTPTSTPLTSGKLFDAFVKDFGSFDAFKNQFTDAAKTRFGSGWAWLILTSQNKLAIASTPNQDNPLMDISDVNGTPLLGLDVWEHAYYLRYTNKRADYINNWWNIINWSVIENRYLSAIK